MSTQVGAYFITVRDSQGRTARTNGFVSFDPTTDGFIVSVQSILTPYTACTNGAIQNSSIAVPGEVVYGTDAEFPSVEDRMVLLFQDGVGARHLFTVPAPKAANFASDGMTVLNTGISAALITALQTYGTTRQGSGVFAYLAGWRKKARNQRRTSSLVKTPAGTGQAVP